MNRTISLIFAFLLSVCVLKAADDYDVYLLIGQSNAVGFAPLEPGDEKPVEGAYLLDSDGNIVPLSGVVNRFSSLPKLGNRSGFSLAVTFSDMMHKATGRKILIVSNAKGATTINQWLPTTGPQNIDGVESDFYQEAVRRTRQAQKYGKVKGILWHQGEGDIRWIGQYTKRANVLFSSLRSDLGDDSIPVVVGEVGHWLVSRDGKVNSSEINRILRELPISIPNLLCATSEDCEPIYDKIHFNHKALETLGRRYAAKMLSFGQGVFIEAESFDDKGGWCLDQQFMDQMGSPYLIAHGLGKKVENAVTKVFISKSGWYHVYARTYNWTSPWSSKEGPGKFRIKAGQQLLRNTLGCTGNSWGWEYAGKVYLPSGKNSFALVDQTGFDGRCDAIWITPNEGKLPPSEKDKLQEFRYNIGAVKAVPSKNASYDFVVIGAGVAGMCAAVAAARQGLNVALVNDRPVLGGNNSAEVRVHLGGHIELGKYPALGRMLREFGHDKFGNAEPAENYHDDWKQKFIDSQKGVTTYLGHRVMAATTADGKITSVTLRNIETGEEFELSAPLFSDCTGDGQVGFLAGAEYRMGRESRSEYGESLAPEKADKMTMGSSVQWYATDAGTQTTFPEFDYGLNFNDETCERLVKGDWMWETGMHFDQIEQFERIRDYGMLVVYSNWSYLKNRLKDNSEFTNKQLEWVAYIAGKRESRRLIGDYVMTQIDIDEDIKTPDPTATTSWSIDIHWPEKKNEENFGGEAFKSETQHLRIYPHAVPYRCLYSKNISNLFMAGRNISVTHVALGNVRVMRTTAMLGEVVGLAASVCKRNNAIPRDVYQKHWSELDALMQKGAALDKELPDNQHFNYQKPLDKPRVSKYTVQTNM